MSDVHERLNDLDQARHRDNIQTRERFDAVEGRVNVLEDRARTKSEKLDSTILKFTEELSRVRIDIASMRSEIKIILWVLGAVAIAIIGSLVNSWF